MGLLVVRGGFLICIICYDCGMIKMRRRRRMSKVKRKRKSGARRCDLWTHFRVLIDSVFLRHSLANANRYTQYEDLICVRG